MSQAVENWETLGARRSVRGRDIFVVDFDPTGVPAGDPILILHGFPSSSFDWRAVVPALSQHRRVVALDMLGYGLSDKPDIAYSLFEQADIVEGVATSLGFDRVALITHDMGDSVGGELLARSLDGTLPFEISRRVITNGSIYMDLVELSVGQQLMLALPDARLEAESAPTAELIKGSLAATFAAEHAPDREELQAQWELIARRDGHRLLPRLIRYVEERRIHEKRWTGAIEGHGSPLGIVWGERDPIAVIAMAHRLARMRPDATFAVLEDVGHYPMIEAPARTANAIMVALG